MITLLTSHTIGRKRSHRRLLMLTNSFTFGAGVMTVLLLSTLALLFNHAGDQFMSSLLVWTIACGLLAGVGISVLMFYYRHEYGTTLWVPRGVARFLTGRTKATKQSAEAFSLGLSSVIGELLFIIAPLRPSLSWFSAARDCPYRRRAQHQSHPEMARGKQALSSVRRG